MKTTLKRRLVGALAAGAMAVSLVGVSAAPEAEAATLCVNTTLKKGSKNDCVLYLQLMLNAITTLDTNYTSNYLLPGSRDAYAGRYVLPDGSYGTEMAYAVYNVERYWNYNWAGWYNLGRIRENWPPETAEVGPQVWRAVCGVAKYWNWAFYHYPKGLGCSTII